MTSATLTPEIQDTPNALRRLINVVRLHLVNKTQIIVMPWLIMSFIFIVSLTIGWIFRSANETASPDKEQLVMEFNGALFYFLIYMLVLAVMAISQTFPFAQSYSVTRRDFYLGTVLTFLGLSTMYSLAVTVLSWIEDTTDGWGLNVVIFNPGFMTENLFARFYIMLVLFFFFFMMGMATASVYVRWRANGMYVFFGSLALLILGLVWLANSTNSWAAVGNWIVTSGVFGIVTWSLVPSILALITGYLFLQRATPRN